MGTPIRDLRDKEHFIVDDAYLNGYAKLCGIYATGVYLSLCRHANTEQKSWPGREKIAEELAISTDSVDRGIAALKSLGIITVEQFGKKMTNRYTLVDKSAWLGDSAHSQPTSDSAISGVGLRPQRSHLAAISGVHSKETHSKETHVRIVTDTNVSVRSDADIISLIKIFSDINPSLAYGNTTQRKAASWLIEKFGPEKAVKMAEAAVSVLRQPYAPTITTPLELKNNVARLAAFLARGQKPRSGQIQSL